MGYNLQDLAPIAITFVVAAIVLGFGAKVLAEISADLTGTSQSIVDNGTESLNTIGKYLPTLGLIVVAALIISVVVGAFYFAGRK